MQINVKTFGAVGDGIADDTAAVQAALNCAAANVSIVSGPFTRGVTVYIPAGRYKCNNALSYSGGSMTILGDRPFVSGLYFSGVGGLSITLTTNEARVNISGLDFQAGFESCGTALSISSPSTGSSNIQHASIQDLYIWSDYGTAYWTRGILLNDCWHYLLEGVFFKGTSNIPNWGDFVELLADRSTVVLLTAGRMVLIDLST